MPMFAVHLAQVLLPEQLAAGVQAVEAARAEKGKNQFAVGLGQTQRQRALENAPARGHVLGDSDYRGARRQAAGCHLGRFFGHASAEPPMSSPLLYGDSLYTLQHYQGIVSRPVGAAGRIYITSRDGVTQVISHGDKTPRNLAVNRLPQLNWGSE